MTRECTVLPFQHPDVLDCLLTSVLWEGARRLLAQAVETEAKAFQAGQVSAGKKLVHDCRD